MLGYDIELHVFYEQVTRYSLLYSIVYADNSLCANI